jgi:hypothetical protein
LQEIANGLACRQDILLTEYSVKPILSLVAWEVEFTDEFEGWWSNLTEDEQESVDFGVRLLEERGVALDHPYSSRVEQSRHGRMRELRVQHQGRPYRVLYAFDPRRTVILLIGGDKTGHDRWYEEQVPRADDLYDQHVAALKAEGLLPHDKS